MKLLFVCTHNRCRSVLSEVITRDIAAERIQVASAGSAPAGEIHPLTLRHLQAAGLPVDGLHSQGFDDVKDFDPDVVITVCDRAAQEACPLWLGPALKIHWGLPDPSSEALSEEESEAAFAEVMARIRRRASALLAEPLDNLGNEQLRARLEALSDL